MALRVRALLLAAAAVASPVVAAPAAAHGGGAALEVLEAEQVAPGTVSLQVAITYESDGDAATGAIVDVVPTGPGGEVAPAVRLERDATGAYAATLDLSEPGRWTLAVTSSFPPGSTEVPVEVGETAAAEDEPGAVPVEGAAASEPPGTSEVLDEPEAGGAEGGSDATNLVVAAVSGLVGGALGLWVSRRRSARRRASSAE